MAKRFFYVCGGVLMLMAAFHLGAREARGQAPGASVVGVGAGFIVVAANGDVFAPLNEPGPIYFHKLGNVFAGGPSGAAKETWGKVKSRFEK